MKNNNNKIDYSENDILNLLHQSYGPMDCDIAQLSALTLAYIGDAVFEIIIRSLIVEKYRGNVKKMHKKSSSLVNAGSQSLLIKEILPYLSEEERAVYQRGRNAKSHSVAKNASVADYRRATGFEALMGYLYLSGNVSRCVELISEVLDSEKL
ncbi:Mini-ribonuclease 3 [Eubacterium xylanophilum]|uniref:Mini-ribonuclease 3 n=1 Tax=Eubacterium xylanophilum TaxID=39497 RepID=UPI0004B09946|nr:ribonuclease III domain-containing protein [Eubacterium xylanophilum]